MAQLTEALLVAFPRVKGKQVVQVVVPAQALHPKGVEQREQVEDFLTQQHNRTNEK